MEKVCQYPSSPIRGRHMAFAVLIALALAMPASAQGTFPLRFFPSGGLEKSGGAPMQMLALSPDKPACVSKVPDGVNAPLYGVFTFGPPAKQVSIAVLLDEPVVGTPRLFVDSDADGDLTDDPVPLLVTIHYKDTSGIVRTRYDGKALVRMPSAGNGVPIPVTLDFNRPDKEDPDEGDMKRMLLYSPDYISEARVRLGGKTYPALLEDSNATGDCTTLKNLLLLIDVNGDGQFQGESEEYQADKPFNISGTTYEISAVTPDGRRLTIVKSPKSVAEIPPAPNLNVGRKAPTFAAKSTDGRIIDLSESYKGKLVLLDFWATWCVPCVAEQPTIIQAYQTFHGQGFDVLGISLDKKDEWGKSGATNLTDFTQKHGMTWPQIYDDGGSQSKLALLYGIWSIPAAILVDGDTGRILATSNSLRGDRLVPTLTQALARKRQSQAAPTPRSASSKQ